MVAPASSPSSRYGVFPVFARPRQTGNTPFRERLDGHIPVAAAAQLRPVLTGAPRSGAALTSGRLAAYVRIDGRAEERADMPAAGAAVTARPQVVAVVAQGAVVPAGALVLPAGLSPADVLEVGQRVVIGGGRMVIAASVGAPPWLGPRHVVLRPARWFSSPRVVAGEPSAPAARALETRLAALPQPPSDVAHARSNAVAAARALAEGRRDEATDLLVSGLGLGPGATPSGDDVAAGVLLAARAVASPTQMAVVKDVAGRVADLAIVRTTAVSAALLADAAAGWCAEPVVRALGVLAPPVRRKPGNDRALDGLLALGHYSGADLATGLLAVVTIACLPATVEAR